MSSRSWRRFWDVMESKGLARKPAKRWPDCLVSDEEVMTIDRVCKLYSWPQTFLTGPRIDG
jgi:hypothetical protein